MRLSFRFLAGFAVVLLGALSAVPLAQAQSTATLNGTLTDPSGAAVARAEVSAERLPAAAGSVLRTASDADGRFALALAPGDYRVRVTHPSFARAEQQVTLTAGETREVHLRLELEPLAATVVVSAQAEPAPAESTSAPVTVLTRQQIEQRQATSLPNLLATLPGFSLARTGREGGVASLFLNGGNSNFTKVLVDGTSINEPGGAVNFSNLTLEDVEKIEVVSGAESALFGSDAMTGVVRSSRTAARRGGRSSHCSPREAGFPPRAARPC
jgi:outer membrane receptor protein involved in Fe transport